MCLETSENITTLSPPSFTAESLYSVPVSGLDIEKDELILDLDGLDLDTFIQPSAASSEAIATDATATEENSNILEEAIRQNNLQVTSNLEDFNEFLPNADHLSSNVPINTNEDMKPATFRAFVSQPIPKVLQYSETQKTFHIKSGGRFPLQMEAASK